MEASMMTILFMVSVALILSGSFVACYLWSISNGQFDDLTTPALRILKEDIQISKEAERKTDD
jgi:cbb3-type cytochrome oxidase maturation protein